MTNKKTKPDFAACEKILQYRFNNPFLLKQALTHSSCAATHNDSNERLEFLGDSVLGLVVTDLLYHYFPDEDEGNLSKVKATVVSRKKCFELIKQLGLDDFLVLGKGMNSIPNSLLANLMEAFIGAIYIDGGINQARIFIERVFHEVIISEIENKDGADFKSLLQATASQQSQDAEIEYVVLDEQGPSHSRCFKIAVRINHKLYPAAWGNNKKETEQLAAQNAIWVLRLQEPPHPTGDEPFERSDAE